MKCRVEEMGDDGFFHDSCENWGDRDWAEVSVKLRCRNLGHRSDAGVFPLLRNG